jgi:very-short-patch-repair endonuclease
MRSSSEPLLVQGEVGECVLRTHSPGEGSVMYDPRTIPHRRARSLRRDQTAAEVRLWSRLRNASLNGFKFRRQFPIGEFIADFCCPRRRFVIELDGAQHAEQVHRDEWRSALLARHGYRVLRFWNEEIINNLDGVLERILAELGRDLK